MGRGGRGWGGEKGEREGDERTARRREGGGGGRGGRGPHLVMARFKSVVDRDQNHSDQKAKWIVTGLSSHS